MGCSGFQMLTVFTMVILIVAFILPFLLVDIANADIQQAETDTFFLDQQNEWLEAQDDLQQRQALKATDRSALKLERSQVINDKIGYERDMRMFVARGGEHPNPEEVEETVKAFQRRINGLSDRMETCTTKAEHYELIKDYTTMQEWTQETFEYWARETDQTGVSLYEKAFGEEQTRYVEELLDVDFTKPESYNHDNVEQRKSDQLEKLQDFEEDENIANRWSPEKTRSHIPLPTDVKNVGTIDASIESNWTDVTKDSYINAENAAAKVGAVAVMGVTSLSAINIGAMLWQNSKDEDTTVLKNVRENSSLILMVIAIIALACLFGGLGLSAENQNQHFLNITRYAMFSFFGAMLLVQGLCIYNTGALEDAFDLCGGDKNESDSSTSDFGSYKSGSSTESRKTYGEGSDTKSQITRTKTMSTSSTDGTVWTRDTMGHVTRRLLARLAAATSA